MTHNKVDIKNISHCYTYFTLGCRKALRVEAVDLAGDDEHLHKAQWGEDKVMSRGGRGEDLDAYR